MFEKKSVAILRTFIDSKEKLDDWFWEQFTESLDIPISYILENPNLPWNIDALMERSDLTMELYKKYEATYLESHGDIYLPPPKPSVKPVDALQRPRIPIRAYGVYSRSEGRVERF